MTPLTADVLLLAQGFGMLLAPCLAVVLMWLLPGRLDVVWRLLLGLGALPGLAMFYWRCKMPETSHFERAAGKQRHSTLSTIRKNWKTLVGTAGTWFIFDITFYANGLFSTTIIEVCVCVCVCLVSGTHTIQRS